MSQYLKKFIAIIVLLCVFVSMNILSIIALTFSNEGYRGYNTSEWHHRYINTQEAWDLLDTYVPNNEPVKIAAVDCGCDPNNSDIQANLDEEHNVAIKPDGTFVNARTLYPGIDYPKSYHGTVLAAVVGAESNNNYGVAGVASGNKNNLIKIMSINVQTDNIHGFVNSKKKKRNTTTDNIIKGMQYAAKHGARVILMCLGHDETYKDSNNKKFNFKKIQKAIEDILDENKNIIMIASAGNNGNEKTWYMGDYKRVVSVINSSNFTNIYSKSTKTPSSNYGKKKSICAPGNNIYSWDLSHPEPSSHGGTTTASAVAAGVAAMTIYANPKLNGEDVKKILCDGAIDLYKEGFDKYTAYGNVNAYNSVLLALQKQGLAIGEKLKKEVIDADMVPVNISSKVSGKNITLKWNKSDSALGNINQYRVYVKTSSNGKFSKVKTLSAGTTKYIYKASKTNTTYQFKIKPYGTSYDGKMLIPEDNGDSSIIKVRL